jgi:hypothetical protein
MGLVMVCPQCQAKVLLQSQNCPYCQADLRDVPQNQRRYVVGKPGPSTPGPKTVTKSAPAPEPVALPENAPQAESGSSVRIRRHHIRRFAASPVSETHPTKASSSEAGAEPKPAAKKAKKPAAKKKK